MSIKTKNLFAFAFLLFITGCATSPLMKASEHGDIHTAQKLIKEGAQINERDGNGYSPLTYAAWSGQTEVARLLISKGADVNNRDNDNSTPLLWAAYCMHLDVAKLLIDNGADINAQDATGSTALHYTNSPVLTKYLLDRNVDLTLKNDQGWTALRKSIYDKNVGKVALIRKRTNWQGEIYTLTSEEIIGRSVYEPEKDMFYVPSGKEKAYKLAAHDCNTMLFENVSTGKVLLDLNWFGLPALARMASNAYRREELFQQCMAIMGFECKNNCSKNINPSLYKDIADSQTIEEPLPKQNVQSAENNNITKPELSSQNEKNAEKTDSKHNQIIGIVLKDGDVIEGQILKMNAETVIIRTQDGKVSSYSFEKEVRGFVK